MKHPEKNTTTEKINFFRELEKEIYILHPYAKVKYTIDQDQNAVVSIIFYYKGKNHVVSYTLTGSLMDKYNLNDGVLNFIVQQVQKIITSRILMQEQAMATREKLEELNNVR